MSESVPNVGLIDIRAVTAMLGGCSTRHVRRLADSARMPAPVKLGALLRFRRKTGDPSTGIEDWIAAGCPRVRSAGKALRLAVRP